MLWKMARRFWLMISLIIVAIVALLMGSQWGLALAIAKPDPINAAWEQARAAGSYHFSSTLIQKTIPPATVANVRRTSRTEQHYLKGSNDLRNQQMEMTLWTDGGSVLQAESGVAIRVEAGKTFARRGGGDWQEIDSFTDAIAPQGDFMAYLAALRNVTAHPPEMRNGIAFAAYMHKQMEATMRARGELPPGLNLEVSTTFRDMTGAGELWVGEDGLPLRQTLDLRFPEQQGEWIHAQLTVDFAKYGAAQASFSDRLRGADWQGAWVALPAQLPDLTPLWLLITISALALLFLRYRGLRTVQATVVALVILSQVAGPLLTTFTNVRYFDAQTAKAAAADTQRAENEALRELRSAAVANEFDPHQSPLESVTNDQWEAGLPSPVSNFQASPAAQQVDNGVDSDGDGLSDFVEERVGTQPLLADSDGDGLPDIIEVNGFSFGGQTWYTNPNASDTDGVAATPDQTAPVTSIALDPAGATGQNEWYVAPVVIRVSASDGSAANASGVAETRCVLNPVNAPAGFDELPAGCGYLDGGAEVATDGVYALYAASRDQNDNRETPVSQGFQLDRTPPLVAVTGVSEGGVYPLEAAPTPGCDTQDALSGVATAATVSISGGNGDGTGSFSAACEGAVDQAGNPAPTVSVSYSVQNAPPPVYLSVVLLGHEGVKLNQKVTVHSGAVVANTASAGPFLDSGVELSIGQQSSFLSESSLYGDSVKINQKSSIPAVHYNQLQEGQQVSIGQRVTPLALPVVELPPFPSVSPNGNNITVAQNGSLTLAAGSYGLLKVNQKSTIIFSGGEYHFAAWDVGQQVNLYFQAPSDIRIGGRLTVGPKSVVGPHPSAADLSARDILVYVAGPNGGNGSLSGSPKTAEFGQETALQANVYAPNGTLLVNQKSTVRGALLARWVDIGQEVALTFDSAFATPRAVNASAAFSTPPLPEDEMPEESELTAQSFLPLVSR